MVPQDWWEKVKRLIQDLVDIEYKGEGGLDISKLE